MADAVMWGVLCYTGIGLLFALAFVTRGVAQVDPAARGAPWSFRLLILPGCAALWPWMCAKWFAAARSAGTEHAP